ncbi:hypothetical protein DDT91_19860 [Algoriphagus sp. AK58]|nr:hypothetical protein [Algoriphagus sp. AK58]
MGRKTEDRYFDKLSTSDRRILDFCLFEKFHKPAKATGIKAEIQNKNIGHNSKAGSYSSNLALPTKPFGKSLP